jgi:hypothetical protein
MDLTFLVDIVSNPMVWQAGGAAVTLLAGGVTGAKVAAATGTVVASLADAALSNDAKRLAAIDELYKAFPVVSRFVPKALLGALVELMWQQVIKPLLKK